LLLPLLLLLSYSAVKPLHLLLLLHCSPAYPCVMPLSVLLLRCLLLVQDEAAALPAAADQSAAAGYCQLLVQTAAAAQLNRSCDKIVAARTYSTSSTSSSSTW
jgi:hypothetical protein